MILVAGGTGFVGSGIVRELARRGKPVRVMSREAERAARRFAGLDVQAVAGDVRDPESLARAVEGAETVIGCAQFPNSPIENPRRGLTFEEIDERGTVRLVEAARAARVRRYIYLSGAGASPDARYHWFRAKGRAEAAVRDSSITHVIFRPSWIYGPEDRSLNRFLGLARRLPFVPVVGAGSRQRVQPVFIDDVARVVADSVELAAADNRTFELGGPEVLTMDEVVGTALQVMGKRRPLIHMPVGLLKAFGLVSRFLPRPPMTPDAVDFVTADALADNAALLEVFDIRLIPLREGLATYLAPERAAGGRDR
ncbi:MAG: complex I NDUFA9 subunit family protein [Dehalococcoidia bacterium]